MLDRTRSVSKTSIYSVQSLSFKRCPMDVLWEGGVLTCSMLCVHELLNLQGQDKRPSENPFVSGFYIRIMFILQLGQKINPFIAFTNDRFADFKPDLLQVLKRELLRILKSRH